MDRIGGVGRQMYANRQARPMTEPTGALVVDENAEPTGALS